MPALPRAVARDFSKVKNESVCRISRLAESCPSGNTRSRRSLSGSSVACVFPGRNLDRLRSVCLIALHFLQDAGRPVIFLILLAFAGFLIYGPQALLGVSAANIATKKAASSAVGLIGFMSYLSTMITGVGFGALADRFGGWGWIFITMGALAVVGTALIMSIWNLKEADAE